MVQQAFLISTDFRLHYLDSAVVGTIQLYGDHDGSQGGETNCAQIGRKISSLTQWQSYRKYLELGATLAAGAIGSIAFKEA
jgi:hypothetical protein